jgi:fimbrial chaperone protein
MSGLCRMLSIAVLVSLLLLSVTATASTSLLIWPLNPTIEAGQKAGVLWLENVGNAPVTLQIRVLAWEQANFEDRYSEQQVVVGTPPFSTIAPGKKQFVRLTLVAPPAPGEERAFRVLVDEIPGPAPVASTGLRLQMRYSLPLFAYGEGLWGKQQRRAAHGMRAQPSLSWKLVEEGGTSYLQVDNTGSGHARLSRVRFVTRAGAAGNTGDDGIDVASGLLGYVLPGRVMRWPVPQGVSSSHQLQVQLETNAPSLTLPIR